MKRIILLICLAISTPAWADISDSGNLVIGGTATIQGNAFSVGGSTLSVSLGTVTTGGLLQLSNSGVKFGDGTIQTTAATSPNAWTSTWTYITNQETFGSSAGWPCHAQSTVTATMNGGRADLQFSCVMQNASGGGNMAEFTYLINGRPVPSPLGLAGRGLIHNGEGSVTVSETMIYKTTFTLSGSTSFCIGRRTDGSSTGVLGRSTQICQFFVQEIAP